MISKNNTLSKKDGLAGGQQQKKPFSIEVNVRGLDECLSFIDMKYI